MRIFIRALTGLFIILWIAVVVCYIYIRLNGPQLVMETLSEVFHKPVQMNSTYFIFPFGLRINDLKIGEKTETIEIKDVQIQVGIPDFLHRRVHFLFMSLSQPLLSISRTKNSKMVLGNSGAEPVSSQTNKENPQPKQVNPSGRTAQKNKQPVILIIDYLVVEKGKIKFCDFSREKKFELTLQDIGLKAQNAAIPPQPLDTKFDLNATIFKENSSSNLPFSGSRVESGGWVNFYKKDMQAKLEVIDSAGKVSMSSEFNAKDNELTLKGKVHIYNLIARPQTETDAPSSSLKDLIFSSLQSSGVEITADFHSKTKMDDFHLDAVTFSGNLGYKPLASQSDSTSSQSAEGKNIGQQFEELGKKIYKENVQEPMNKEAPGSQ